MVYVRPKSGEKPGPKKCVESRRKRCDLRVPPAKPRRRYLAMRPKEHKRQVLLWLIDSRVAVHRAPGNEAIIVTMAVRTGMNRLTPEQEEIVKESFYENGVAYRPPLYSEAATFWKISKGSIASWWYQRHKLLSPAELERANKLIPWENAPGMGFPSSDPPPRVISEATAATAGDDGPERDFDDADADDDDDDDLDIDNDVDDEMEETEVAWNGQIIADGPGRLTGNDAGQRQAGEEERGCSSSDADAQGESVEQVEI